MPVLDPTTADKFLEIVTNMFAIWGFFSFVYFLMGFLPVGLTKRSGRDII